MNSDKNDEFYYKFQKWLEQEDTEDANNKEFIDKLQINNDAYALAKRANSYLRLSEYNSALMDINNALRIDGNKSDFYYIRGNIFFELEDYQNAIKDYANAILLSSKNYEYYFKRGQTYEKLNDFDNAVTDYSTAFSLKNNIQILIYRATAFMELKNYDSAIIDYNNIIEQTDEPTYLKVAYRQKSFALFKQKKYDEALIILSFAKGIDSEDFYTYMQEGEIYYKLNQLEKSLLSLEKAIEIYPEYPKLHYLKSIVNIGLSLFYDALENLNNAICLYYEAKEDEEFLNIMFEKDELPIENYYYLRAMVKYKLEQYTEAINDLNIVLKILPNNEKCKYYISQIQNIYSKVNDNTETSEKYGNVYEEEPFYSISDDNPFDESLFDEEGKYIGF